MGARPNSDLRADGSDELCVHQRMLAVAASRTAAEITVVALPCAWVYCVVGQHPFAKGPPAKNHPYRDWLMLYASPELPKCSWPGCGRKSISGPRPRQRKNGGWRKPSSSARGTVDVLGMAWNEEKWPV